MLRVVYPGVERDLGEHDGAAVQLAGRAVGGEAISNDGGPLGCRESGERRAEPCPGAPAQIGAEERSETGKRQLAIGEGSDEVRIVAGRAGNHNRDERSEYLVQQYGIVVERGGICVRQDAERRACHREPGGDQTELAENLSARDSLHLRLLLGTRAGYEGTIKGG